MNAAEHVHPGDSRPGVGGQIAECTYMRRPEYKHRRSRAACRLASGSSLLGYELASEHGLYGYSAFGNTTEDTATLTQQLRWKARWQYTLNGAELYDVRARQWSPSRSR